jgi:hypothetical protein
VTISGLSSNNPTTKGVSSPREIKFTTEDLTAGLYYWNATDGTIWRFDFGRPDIPPISWWTASGGFCVGCHALSRDGLYAAIGEDSPSPSRINLVDVANDQLLWFGDYGSTEGSNYQTFSPDASMVLTTDGFTMRIRDTLTGADLGFGNADEDALFPDWSPDGSSIVYSRAMTGYCSSSPCSMFTTGQGALMKVSWDGLTFGTPSDLIPFDGQHNNYYPTITSDNEWTIFNRVSAEDITSGSMDSYDNRAAALWAVSMDGGTPVRMDAANGGYLGNSWPKVTPVMKDYSGGRVAFVTFSSRRPVGLSPDGGEWGIAQIWMAAFDPDRAAAGLDPSFPAVHLPWQELSSGNHIAQWATEIPYEPCGPQGECPDEFECEDGECIPIID